MSNKNIAEPNEHERNDEAELERLENNFDRDDVQVETTRPGLAKSARAWIITAVIAGVIAVLGIIWIASRSSSTDVNVAVKEEKKEEPGHTEGEEGEEVKLDPEMLESAGIQTETVTQRPAIAKLYVTGAVELNPETTEMAT
ncbi:MAG: hypothetical protein KA956_15990, partial [Pyrinomonadaceae bacterium]|nr:hypothetical protein [Pyrinomonadaceae bacterium]